MKQKLTLTCVMIFIVLTANAQRIGIKAGLNLAKAKYEYQSTSISTSNLTGFHLGLIYDVPISNQLYFNSGLLYSQKGTKMEFMGIQVDFPISYFEMPLNLEYKYDEGKVKVFAQAGPYIGVGLSARMKGAGEDIEVEFGSDADQMKRIDVGANFGGGVEIGNVQLGIDYGLGLVNLSHDGQEVLKNGVLGLSLGLFFGK